MDKHFLHKGVFKTEIIHFLEDGQEYTRKNIVAEYMVTNETERSVTYHYVITDNGEVVRAGHITGDASNAMVRHEIYDMFAAICKKYQ